MAKTAGPNEEKLNQRIIDVKRVPIPDQPDLESKSNGNEPEKTRFYKQNGHYVNNRVINTSPHFKKGVEQLKFDFKNQEFYSNLTDEQKALPDKVSSIGDAGQLVPGIHLTPTQDRLMNVLLRILDEAVTTGRGVRTEKDLSYGKLEGKQAVLECTKYKLITLYYGSKDYGIKHSDNVMGILDDLTKKKFWISYSRKYYDKNQKLRIDRINQYKEIVTLTYGFKGLTEEEDSRIQVNDTSIDHRKGKLIITLHSLFLDQLETFYVRFPTDLDSQIAKAAGGMLNVTSAMNNLGKHLFRKIRYYNPKDPKNNKNYFEITKGELSFTLGLEKKALRSDWVYINKRIEEAVDVFVNLNMLIKMEERESVRPGETVCIFYFNTEYLPRDDKD